MPKSETNSTAIAGSSPVPCSPSSVEDAVVDLIRSRGKVGRGKYKTTMDRRDLRPEQWMQHLQEELGDALQYAERVKNCGKLLDDARSIMLTLLHERDWECAAEWVARHDAQFFPENVKEHTTPRNDA